MAIHRTQAHAMTPTKLSSTQTAICKLRHDLRELGTRAPPLLFSNSRFIAQSLQFSTRNCALGIVPRRQSQTV